MAQSDVQPKPVGEEEEGAPSSMAPAFRAGFVTLLGRPNVGKSTLLNQLLSFKLSIVSPKPQTTRHVIRGVVHGEGYQVVFLDTPGLMRRPMHQLDLRMLQSLQFAAGEADLLLLVVEPKMPGDIEARFMEELRQQEKPVFLVVNKVDTVAKPHLLPVLEEYEKRYPFQELVPISALMGDGVALLLDLVVRRLPEGEALYPPDELTDRSERFLAGEIIREKVYRLYKEEVPHATTVAIETFVEQSSEHGGKDYISAIIYVERDTQRRILIGRGGLALKQVGVEARKDIEEMLGRPVHLEMWVKSASRWRQNPVFLQEMGY